MHRNDCTVGKEMIAIGEVYDSIKRPDNEKILSEVDMDWTPAAFLKEKMNRSKNVFINSMPANVAL